MGFPDLFGLNMQRTEVKCLRARQLHEFPHSHSASALQAFPLSHCRYNQPTLYANRQHSDSDYLVSNLGRIHFFLVVVPRFVSVERQRS